MKCFGGWSHILVRKCPEQRKYQTIMIQESDENIIRKHLLGTLTEEELSRAEEKLFADDDYFELLNVIEEELIDDYISGDMAEDDRKRFEAHFLSTPERHEKLKFAQTLNEHVWRTAPVEENGSRANAGANDVNTSSNTIRPARWKQLVSSPYWGLAAAALVVIVIGIVVWPLIFPGTGASEATAALREAYRAQRPVESRITGFDYAPIAVTRGENPGKGNNLEHDRAKLMLLSEAQKHPGAEVYHALGEVYLAELNFDQAIEYINRAIQLNDSDPGFFSDLGAAYLEKGKFKRDRSELSESSKAFDQSLNYLTRALELDHSRPEALFNIALCHQYMNNVQQAREAWRKYLEKDPASPWADEAKRNLKLLE